MGDSFTAVPSAIARTGSEFVQQGAQLGQSASSFGGGIFEVSNAFGLLGACDGAMEKYISMAHSTIQGLEQLANLWIATGEQLGAQAEAYQIVEQEQQQRFHGIQRGLSGSGGGR